MKTTLLLPLLLLSSLIVAGCATAPATQSELMQHYQTARAAAAAKQYDIALREYTWCWHSGEEVADFQDFRRHELLGDFVALARDYPPAVDSLRSLEKQAHSEAEEPRVFPTYSSSGGYLGSAQEARDMDAVRNDSNSRSESATRSSYYPPRDDSPSTPSVAEQNRRRNARLDDNALRVAISEAGLR